MRLLRFTKALIFVLGLGAASSEARDFERDGTGVRNGGDTVRKFLATTRLIYRKTLLELSLKLSQDGALPPLCTELEAADKAAFCATFLASTMEQLLEMSDANSGVRLETSKDPLFAPGPDGREIPVQALTEPGNPRGDILFHYDSIKVMSPFDLFVLLGHELGHKPLYAGKAVFDYEPIGPFAYGKDLLDALAESLGKIAKQLGYLQGGFELIDRFACTLFDRGQPYFATELHARRWFVGENADFGRYEVGIGVHPTDPPFKVFYASRWFEFRLLIEEGHGCGEGPGEDEGRRTGLELYELKENHELGTRLGSGVKNNNPICSAESRRMSVELDYGDLRFACQYVGSYAISSRSVAASEGGPN